MAFGHKFSDINIVFVAQACVFLTYVLFCCVAPRALWIFCYKIQGALFSVCGDNNVGRHAGFDLGRAKATADTMIIFSYAPGNCFLRSHLVPRQSPCRIDEVGRFGFRVYLLLVSRCPESLRFATEEIVRDTCFSVIGAAHFVQYGEILRFIRFSKKTVIRCILVILAPLSGF